MKLSQANHARMIFDKLDDPTKYKIYQEMLNLGLRIASKETTWHGHIRLRTKTTKGELKRFFCALTNFTKVDVEVFLDAFSNTKANIQ